jgi:hypothetical protein
MQFETVNCPQCGGPLKGVGEPGFYTCPYCRSKIRVSFSNSDPHRRPDGRLTIHDKRTGQEICYVLLPAGWTVEGALYPSLQSANWPITLSVKAFSSDREAVIEYQSGSAYKDVRTGITPHVEGKYDHADMVPMKRMMDPVSYADSIFNGMADLYQDVSLLDTRPLPKEPPIDYSLKAQETCQLMGQQLASHTPSGMWAQIDGCFYDGSTRIYDYSYKGREWRMAIAVLINGFQISGGASGLFFAPAMSYMMWEAQYVVTLKAPREEFDRYYADYVMFSSTMQASPGLVTQIEQERARIMGQLQQQQADWFRGHMKIMSEQQASFDAYNQAWFARSDRQHQAMRQSFDPRSAHDRIFDKYSEAVRGVDTYLRPDGTEVEYSVINEAAFSSATDSQTTFATQAGDFQSIDWVEMKKKY